MICVPFTASRQHPQTFRRTRRGPAGFAIARGSWRAALAAVVWAALMPVAYAQDAPAEELLLVVMDPLAAPLSCPCVQGYAQRKYEHLADYLQEKTGRAVRVTFAESLQKALDGDSPGQPGLIIGKDSVVRYDARRAGLAVTPVACLSGKDGLTTQTGLIVVPAGDPAREVAQLKGYRIFFGLEEAEEKQAAALDLLRRNGVPRPEPLETSAACSEGACRTLELGPGVRAAAVISSYAKPLLEGCGTIQRGDLRVIGETAPVPFITAFVGDHLPAAQRAEIQRALLATGPDPQLCAALETLLGFVPIAAPASKKN